MGIKSLFLLMLTVFLVACSSGEPMSEKQDKVWIDKVVDRIYLNNSIEETLLEFGYDIELKEKKGILLINSKLGRSKGYKIDNLLNNLKSKLLNVGYLRYIIKYKDGEFNRKLY